MEDDKNHAILSPAVLQVLDDFASSMRADEGIEAAAVDRLEALLKKPFVPKPSEIHLAVFDISLEDLL